MWPRLTSTDFRVMGHYLGTLILMLGVLMIVPLTVALVLGEHDEVGNFLIGGGICLLSGNLLRLLHVRPGRLTRRQALLVVGFGWPILAMIAAIPMYLSGLYSSFLNAAFDGISVLTTTGFSICDDYDHLAVSQGLWRILLVFIGGQGVLVVALSLGFFGHSGSAGSIYKSEGRTEQVLPNVIQSTRFIWAVSGAIVLIATVIGTVLSLTLGMGFWRSLYNGFFLAISSYDTGGVTPQSTSLIYYHSWAIELYCAFFALMGVINFSLYLHFGQKNDHELKANSEAKGYVVWLSVLVAVTIVVVIGDGYYTTLPEVIRHGLFMAIYTSTTAGLQNIYSDQLGLSFTGGAMVVLMIMMIVGSASGSTGGGIKMSRMVVIFKWLWANIKRPLLPGTAIQHVKYHQFVDRPITSELATQAMMIFVLYVFTGVGGGMLGIAYGYEAMPAMFESFACVANDGVTAGIISMHMPVLLKVFYAFEMYAGRLEFVAFLATFAELFATLFSIRHRTGGDRPASKDSARGGSRKGSGKAGARAASLTVVCVALVTAGALFPTTASAVTYDEGGLTSQTADSVRGMPTSTSIDVLVAADDSFDGEYVTFAGEAIGEPIAAGDGHKWVNVLDNGKLIGVYMTDAQCAAVTNWGAHEVKGTELSIVGVFNVACEAHDGDLDVHAEKVSVVSPGGALPQTDTSYKYWIGGGLVALGLAAMFVYHRKLKASL